MAFMAKDKIVRTGDDLNLATLVALQSDAAILGGVADAAAGVAMTADGRITKVVKVPLVAAAGTTAGGVLNWLNPEASAILVTRFIVELTGVKSGQTVNFGKSAATAAPSDNLIDGMSTATAGVFDNLDDTDNGTNGKTKQKLAVGERVTGTASDALTGATFAGSAYIHYIVL